jgi:L-asparaginase
MQGPQAVLREEHAKFGEPLFSFFGAAIGLCMAVLPKVGLIITGGTIDSVGVDRLDLAWYIEANKRLGDGELLAQLPELKTIARVEEIPFRRLPSQALVDSDWLQLVEKIHSAFDQDQAAGIVVTHGTNTLEETAYFLNLVLKTDRPVVLVGSMRPSSAISADGYLNVVNAVRVAADPQSKGRGCLVVMNDTIFNGRDVTKNSTYRVEAFQSRDMGPLGVADADGKVVYYHRPERKHTTQTEFDLATMTALPRVDIVLSYVNADGIMIEAAAKAGARGIVSAATGAGRPTPTQDDAFDRAYEEHGMLMCLCSRVASGRVVRSPGLKRKGFVAADNLQPWKARILLSLALSLTTDADEIQRIFDTY